jgi:hypothetical protein
MRVADMFEDGGRVDAVNKLTLRTRISTNLTLSCVGSRQEGLWEDLYCIWLAGLEHRDFEDLG